MSVFDLIYTIAIIVFSPFLVIKLLIDRGFRDDFSARFLSKPIQPEHSPHNESTRIWVHAASIGEVRLAIKLIHAWMKVDSQNSFFITTNTQQSRDLGQKQTDIPVLVAPVDLSCVVKRFIQQTHPNHLVLVETEIWPNMIRLMAERGHVTIVNGRLSDRYFKRYLLFKRLLSKTVCHFDRVLARDQVSAERFQKLGIPADRVVNQGNLKYEVPTPPASQILAKVKSHLSMEENSYLMVAGSVQPEELIYLLPAWKRLLKKISGFQMVLIPRHPDKKSDFARILAENDISCSFASDTGNSGSPKKKEHIYVVDQIGVLRTWYYIADVIFVGGSLCDRGGQNMVEAVGYQKSVCIGPYATNFKDEVDLLTQVEGLKIVNNEDELYNFVHNSHEYPDQASAMGKRGYTAIVEQAHALDANVQKLSEIYRNP